MDHKGLPRALPIVRVETLNDRTRTLELGGAMDAVPGQFVMAWLPGIDEKPFSLAFANPIRLTVAAVGPFSQALHELAVGDLLWVRGPLGCGYQVPTQPGPALLIGGGYGVAPLCFLAGHLQAAGHGVAMIIGARTSRELLLIDAVQAMGISLWLATEDGSAGIQGLVTDAMPEVLATNGPVPSMVYACGPTGMLQAVAAVCRAHGLPMQLSWEAHMRCGIGLCGSCEVGSGWLVCLDGPVFPFDPLQLSPQQLATA